MTSVDVFEGLEGMTVVEVAEAKGGGLTILFAEGPTILIVGGENDTMCVQSEGISDEVSWKTFWDNVRI